MCQMTLLTGERRRTSSEDQKLAILSEAFAPGAVVAEVARRYEMSTGLIYTWRREVLSAQDGGGFVPARFVDGAGGVRPAAVRVPAIVVELAQGARVTISADTPTALVTATLRALR